MTMQLEKAGSGGSTKPKIQRGQRRGNPISNMSIRSKVLFVFLASGLIPLTFMSLFAYTQFSQNLQDQVLLGSVRTWLLGTFVVAAGVGAVVSILIAQALASPAKKLLNDVKKMAEGDLAVRPSAESRDEIGLLAAGFAEIAASEARLINGIKSSATEIGTMAEQYAESSRQIASTIQQMTAGGQQIAKGATDQATAAQSTMSLMDQMNTKIKDVADAAEMATAGAREDTKNADEGLNAAKEAQSKMNDISASSMKSTEVVRGLVTRSKEIGQTATVITGIADQTNLLALNAAIEAARAGEHGRGFAVVAEEVRKLAEESKKAADQIAKLNDEIQTETTNAVNAIAENASQSQAGVAVINSKVLTTLDKIQRTAKQTEATVLGISEVAKMQLDFAGRVATAMSSVAAASEEASATTEEFSSSIEEINSGVEENAAGAEQLGYVVNKLNDLVKLYKVDASEETQTAPDLVPKQAATEKVFGKLEPTVAVEV